MYDNTINELIDRLALEHKKLESKEENTFTRQYTILTVLLFMWEAFQKKRRKYGREADKVRDVIKELNPSFYKGYFERPVLRNPPVENK